MSGAWMCCLLRGCVSNVQCGKTICFGDFVHQKRPTLKIFMLVLGSPSPYDDGEKNLRCPRPRKNRRAQNAKGPVASRTPCMFQKLFFLRVPSAPTCFYLSAARFAVTCRARLWTISLRRVVCHAFGFIFCPQRMAHFVASTCTYRALELRFFSIGKRIFGSATGQFQEAVVFRNGEHMRSPWGVASHSTSWHGTPSPHDALMLVLFRSVMWSSTALTRVTSWRWHSTGSTAMVAVGVMLATSSSCTRRPRRARGFQTTGVGAVSCLWRSMACGVLSTRWTGVLDTNQRWVTFWNSVLCIKCCTLVAMFWTSVLCIIFVGGTCVFATLWLDSCCCGLLMDFCVRSGQMWVFGSHGSQLVDDELVAGMMSGEVHELLEPSYVPQGGVASFLEEAFFSWLRPSGRGRLRSFWKTCRVHGRDLRWYARSSSCWSRLRERSTERRHWLSKRAYSANVPSFRTAKMLHQALSSDSGTRVHGESHWRSHFDVQLVDG